MTQGKRMTKRASKTRKGNQNVLAVPKGVPRITGLTGLVYGFPMQLLTRLRYCDTNPLVSTLGGQAKYVLRLNSTFDPDLTSAGHQPLYRDTYAAIYDHYAVISTRVEVTFVNTGSVPLICGCLVEDDSSSSTTTSVLMEQTTGQHKLVPAQAGSLSSHTFVHEWICKRDLGIDPFASETYKTAVGLNPSEDADFVMWAQPVDLASSTTTYITYEMEQTVLWTELTTPTQS